MLNRIPVKERYPVILDADYSVGFKERYFAKSKISNYILEIDKGTYDGLANGSSYPSELYDILKLTWKLNGPMHDMQNGNALIYGVFDTNLRVVKKARSVMKGIEQKLSDLTQFAHISETPKITTKTPDLVTS